MSNTIVPHVDGTAHDRHPQQASVIAAVRTPDSPNADETQTIKPPLPAGVMNPEGEALDDPTAGSPGPKPGNYTVLKIPNTVPGQ